MSDYQQPIPGQEPFDGTAVGIDFWNDAPETSGGKYIDYVGIADLTITAIQYQEEQAEDGRLHRHLRVDLQDGNGKILSDYGWQIKVPYVSMNPKQKAAIMRKLYDKNSKSGLLACFLNEEEILQIAKAGDGVAQWRMIAEYLAPRIEGVWLKVKLVYNDRGWTEVSWAGINYIARADDPEWSKKVIVDPKYDRMVKPTPTPENSLPPVNSYTPPQPTTPPPFAQPNAAIPQAQPAPQTPPNQTPPPFAQPAPKPGAPVPPTSTGPTFF